MRIPDKKNKRTSRKEHTKIANRKLSKKHEEIVFFCEDCLVE